MYYPAGFNLLSTRELRNDMNTTRSINGTSVQCTSRRDPDLDYRRGYLDKRAGRVLAKCPSTAYCEGVRRAKEEQQQGVRSP